MNFYTGFATIAYYDVVMTKHLPQPKISLLAVVMSLSLLALVWQINGAWQFIGQKYAIAVIIGLVAGVALYHAAFGFTAGWRNILADRRGNGLRAQFILIMAVSIISYPLIAYGEAAGLSVRASVAPLSIALLVGAYLFGFGMMFGGGCGSGTLFTAGGGSSRMMIVLAAFILGSLWGTHDVIWWRTLPSLPSFSIIDQFGGIGAVVILAIILAILWRISTALEIGRHGALESRRKTISYISGPWSLGLGIAALAFVSIACFILLGRPWGITSAFALWGAKIAMIFGMDVASWPYWQGREALLNRSLLSDTTSVMNIAIMVGAMLASSLAGKYRPILRIKPIEIISAIIGGLMMGYGARLAYGCNIGAYLGGIVSGSAHGWIWMIAAFGGSGSAIAIKRKWSI